MMFILISFVGIVLFLIENRSKAYLSYAVTRIENEKSASSRKALQAKQLGWLSRRAGELA